MREIDAATTADYLRDSGHVAPGADILVRELAGGVSNIVLRVDVAGQPPIVIKQCRERLRVAMEWHARLDRIWTEFATLGVLRSILPEGTVPDLLFEDRPNYLFAMTCAGRLRHLEESPDGRPDRSWHRRPTGHDPGYDSCRGSASSGLAGNPGGYEPF